MNAVKASPAQTAAPRNPGPSWGYRFMRGCDRVLPEFLFKPLRALGTAVALSRMPEQRKHSRAYLRAVTGREPSLRAVFRHFFAFEEALMLRLRTADGRPHHVYLGPDSAGFQTYLDSGAPALLGTFHVGNSDLTGFLLGAKERRRVFMVRQRVANSHDTDLFGHKLRDLLTFIWVNEAGNLMFALKDAISSGGSIALKCDRLEFSAKTEAFDFLGAQRLFPFTIYHLSLIFHLPVLLSVGLPDGAGGTVVYGSPMFVPDHAGKAANLIRARTHFQAFLTRLETLLRDAPEQWFNFLPLNPKAP